MAAAILAGCTSSSGVVPAGQNTYMIARTQWGFAGTSPIKADALKEADDYCRQRGKTMKVLKIVEKPLKLGSEPAAEMYFQCLEANDPKIKTSPGPQDVQQ